MKTLLLSLTFSLGILPLSAQQLTKDIFLGSWEVVDSQLIPEMSKELDDEGKKMMDQMREGFIGTVFNFKENNEFTVQFPKDVPEFMKELEFINNTKWKIEDGRKIAIGSEEDRYSLMGIFVGVKESKKFFVLDDSPFILQVSKK